MDRTKAHRNSDVSRAVRKTRDRLAQQVGNPVFDRELLKLHARSMIHSAAAIPVLVLLVVAGGLFAGMASELLTWALVTVALYCGLAIMARRVERAETADIDVAATRRYFLIAHFVSGL
ncbi:MAG: sensor histidine kinase, partial [Rhizobiaceae bacterium]